MIDIIAGCRTLARRALGLLLSAAIVSASAAPAWAQRRSAEPEANPSFQSGLQATGAGSGPVGGAVEAEASGPPSGGGAPAADEIPASRSGMGGVQIGTSQPKAAPPERTTPLDARVTVRVKGAPLATFLDTISAQAKVNFIITEGLETKRVTAFLQNVTVREALQVLLEIKGLSYQQIGKSNTYVVTPRSKSVENVITRIYTLSYVPLIPLGTSASEQASITPSINTGGAAATPTSGGGSSGGAGSGGSTTPTSEVAIVSVITSILSKGGKVAIEPRTNALIVTDIPEVFPQVEQIIAELDKKAPQVMIEAQIVEIDSNRTKDLGLEWGGPNGELGTFTAGARDTKFPLVLPNDLSKTRFLDPLGAGSIISSLGSASSSGSSASSSSSGSGLVIGQSFVKTSVLDLTSLAITLRALVSRSEARFLGKPKILTLNNKSAIIQITSIQAVSVTATQQSAGGGLGSQGFTVNTANTGLALKVTPQVNKDGYITMLVQPSFTNLQASALSSGGQQIFDTVTRAASTLVRIKNGQTLVLGGLLESNETKVVRKVPFLGYIPLIGWLFTNTSDTRANLDLVIFITPTVVND
jgi:type II secretory pathway component GspD/PulD (secretin)